MFDIIIIGGGTAGLSAAIYALRGEKSVLVIEKMYTGGQIALTDSVENYPGLEKMSGMDFAAALKKQVDALGGVFVFEEVVRVKDGVTKTVVTDKKEYEAKAVIIAVGVVSRRLGVEGEERLIGRGISFCAVCDGALYKGKKVAIIGGGNTALEDAESLALLAEKVYMVHSGDRFSGEESLALKLKSYSNIVYFFDTAVASFYGDERLEGIELVSGKTGERQKIPVDGAFVAIGYVPQNGVFKNIVEIDNSGYIEAGEDCETSAFGVFAAGDCRSKGVRQLTTAAGDGSVAALAAVKYINENF